MGRATSSFCRSLVASDDAALRRLILIPGMSPSTRNRTLPLVRLRGSLDRDVEDLSLVLAGRAGLRRQPGEPDHEVPAGRLARDAERHGAGRVARRGDLGHRVEVLLAPGVGV